MEKGEQEKTADLAVGLLPSGIDPRPVALLGLEHRDRYFEMQAADKQNGIYIGMTKNCECLVFLLSQRDSSFYLGLRETKEDIADRAFQLTANLGI